MSPNNIGKFSGKADDYARYRPSYPMELIDYLYETAQTDSAADIGAGTGIFTRLLMSKPWRVTAVEPNADMLRKILSHKDISVINGTAEHTGLPDNSVGLVTAATAFHWFDAPSFSKECERILTDKKLAAIIFNGRVSCPMIDERDELMKRACPNYKGGHAGLMSTGDGDRFLRNDFLTDCEYTEYFFEEEYDLERFLGDNFSRSYVPNEGQEGHGYIREALTDIFSRYEKGGKVTIPYRTTCYLGHIKHRKDD